MLALTRIDWVLMQEAPAADSDDLIDRSMKLMGFRGRREKMVKDARRRG